MVLRPPSGFSSGDGRLAAEYSRKGREMGDLAKKHRDAANQAVRVTRSGSICRSAMTLVCRPAVASHSLTSASNAAQAYRSSNQAIRNQVSAALLRFPLACSRPSYSPLHPSCS